MKDIDIHFRQTGNNEYWLLYNHESFLIKTYNDGKFHNKLYECEKEIPEELEWFIDTVIRRELEMEWWYMNKELRKVIKNAIITATKLDGYGQVIIMENDGSYGYTRKYEGCCPEWLGKIIGEVVTFWENGILKAKYVGK